MVACRAETNNNVFEIGRCIGVPILFYTNTKGDAPYNFYYSIYALSPLSVTNSSSINRVTLRNACFCVVNEITARTGNLSTYTVSLCDIATASLNDIRDITSYDWWFASANKVLQLYSRIMCLKLYQSVFVLICFEFFLYFRISGFGICYVIDHLWSLPFRNRGLALHLYIRMPVISLLQ